MGVYPPAAPQGPTKPAVAAIDAGVPTGGDPGTTVVVYATHAGNVPSNTKNQVA